MKEMNLPKMSTIKPRYISNNSSDEFCKNRLKQRFNPTQPNMVWASDITYIRVNKHFCYLCVIMDLFSRKVVGHRISHKADSRLVRELFLQTYENRSQPQGLLFHSDRGSQYTGESFRCVLEKLDIVQSFSAKGYPYDNAVVESFFKYLKKEEIHRRTFQNINDVKLCVFEYIEGFYNSKRAHSANGYLTPDKKELLYLNQSS